MEDVVKEIRDVKTRESLNVLLYTLKFKEPSTDAIRFGKITCIAADPCVAISILVTNYAKKTGDYAFLSAVDLRLLALTYQLYEENVGVEKLNLEPKINVSVSNKGESLEYIFWHTGTDHRLFCVWQLWYQASGICISEEWGQSEELLDRLFR